MVKFNPKNYRRDTLVNILRSQARVGKQEHLRKIRGLNDGIFLEVHNGERWKKKKISSEQVDCIIQELYG